MHIKDTFSLLTRIIMIVTIVCVSHLVDAKNSNLTFGMVKKYVVEGETSQTEILNIFGAPNIMTRNKSGEEVWTYDKIGVDSSSVAGGIGGGIGLPAAGGLAGVGGGVGGSSSSTGSRSMTVMITFDKNDIVKDYAVMSQKF